MNNRSVLILGSGHLANRTKKMVTDKGYAVIHFTSLLSDLPDNNSSTINETKKAFQEFDMGSFAMTYVLYDKDEDNLEIVIALMSLHPSLPVSTSLFNENIRPHLEAANPKLKIINPAKAAAPLFVDALEYSIERKKKTIAKSYNEPKKKQFDSFIKILIAVFAFISLSAASYFHLADGMSWLDSLYFVVVTISTVGYGDINLKDSSDLSKIVGIALILCSSIFIWLIFSLIIDRIIKKRAQRLLGRKKYNYKNHIILCGLGRLGYFIAEELLQKGEKIVIIESNEQSVNIEYFRSHHIDIYNGDARQPHVLLDAGAENCRALISVINNDYINLEIGLNARYFQPNLRLILRIFDESMAVVIKEKFDIHLTQSMSFIAAQRFSSLLE